MIEGENRSGPAPQEPTWDELLDNTPEAVAMRRARAARVKVAERTIRAAARPPAPRSTRRKLILGLALGGAAAARVLGRIAGRQRRP
jgi:hypothetical protein